ncbi:MAG TPA: hypothetical protein VM282_09935 [Acidimicrobiales bacterium]|nr:hypothetical protein [Acidimicrobiales bacterium]
MRVYNDGRTENLGRVDPDVHQRVDDHAALRAQVLVLERFGDLDAARTVLAELIDILDQLDTSKDAKGQSGTKKQDSKQAK